MREIKNYLVEKGWKKSDVNKTIKIIEREKKKAMTLQSSEKCIKTHS